MTRMRKNTGDRAPRAGGRSFDPASKGRKPGPKSKGGPKRDSFKERKPAPKAAAPEERTSAYEGERIAKVMARAGLCSRRDAENWITAGRVEVNGKKLDTPAFTVSATDKVLVDGNPLPTRERTRLWLYHKPKGLVTTNKDPEGRPTVFQRLPDDLPRVLTVGRLDINTEGLLLLTNDGGLARVLELPATGWLRRYRVRAFGQVTQADLDTLSEGLAIDGVLYGGIEATLDKVQGDNCWLTVGLREGKNREVKRVLEHLGLAVNRLIRLSFGPFQLQELEEGEVREIRGRILKDQLGEKLAEEAGADFDAPIFHQPKQEEAPSRKKTQGSRGPRDKNSEARWMTSRDGAAAVHRKKPGSGPKSGGARSFRDDRPNRDEGDRPFRSRPERRIWGEEGLIQDKRQEGRNAERRDQGERPGGGRPERGASGERSGGNRPFRERSDRDRPERDRSERGFSGGEGRPPRGRPSADRPNRDKPKREGPNRGRPNNDRSGRDRPDRGSRPRGRS